MTDALKPSATHDAEQALASFKRAFNAHGRIEVVGESAAWLLGFMEQALRSAPSEIERKPDPQAAIYIHHIKQANAPLFDRPASVHLAGCHWQDVIRMLGETPVSATPTIEFSGLNDPTNWNPQQEFDSLEFTSYTDAKKADVLFNRLQREAQTLREKNEWLNKQLANFTSAA